jgi:trehalose utilization protein
VQAQKSQAITTTLQDSDEDPQERTYAPPAPQKAKSLGLTEQLFARARQSLKHKQQKIWTPEIRERLQKELEAMGLKVIVKGSKSKTYMNFTGKPIRHRRPN